MVLPCLRQILHNLRFLSERDHHSLLTSSLLEPPQIAPFSFSGVVDSGAFAQLTCAVSHGDMPITITWSLKGQELNSGPSITTTMLGQRASILIISSVDYSHVGEYTCRATNPAGSVTYSAELRVNGKRIETLRYFICRETQNHSFLIW